MYYTYWCLLVNGLNNELLVTEGDVPNFTPWKSNFGRQPTTKYVTQNKKEDGVEDCMYPLPITT
jgi:hypothetical protein